ncbi:MAG: tetratricopeptide repeat protein [Phycisphaerae bacterium]|jgi:tetratricopeptide (TPR) repeat protein
MSRVPCFDRRRCGAILLLAAAFILPAGCDRKATETPTTQQAAATGQGSTGFVPPKLTDDQARKLTMSLEMKISSAHWDASHAPDDALKVGRLGTMYFAQQFYEPAAACFAEAARLMPQEMPWWYCTGLAEEAAGRTEQAIAAYDHAVSLEGAYVPAQLHLADLLVERDTARAATLYHDILKIMPDNPRAHYGLGRVAEIGGRQDEALREYRIALSMSPDYPAANAGVARILRATGHEADAQHYARWAEAGGTPTIDDPIGLAVMRSGLAPGVLCDDAVLVAQRGDFVQAESLINQAAEVNPNDIQVLNAMGYIQAMQRRFPEAEKIFRRILEIDPTSVNARSNLAQTLTDAGQHEEAEQLFRSVLAEHPDNVGALQRYELLLKMQNRTAEVIDLLQAAVDADPDNTSLHALLAMRLNSAGRTDDALAHLRRAVELRPDLIAARSTLAIMLKDHDQIPAAQAEWEKILEINPRIVAAYLGLASIALDGHDTHAAEAIFRRGLEHVPEALALQNGLAWTLATSPDDAQRNGEEALALATKVCEQTRYAAHAYLDTLAAALAELGRFDEALSRARQALDLAVKSNATANAEEYRARVALYEQHQPFRQPQ